MLFCDRSPLEDSTVPQNLPSPISYRRSEVLVKLSQCLTPSIFPSRFFLKISNKKGQNKGDEIMSVF